MKAKMIASAIVIAAGTFVDSEIVKAENATLPTVSRTQPLTGFCHAYVLQPAAYQPKVEQVAIVEGSPTYTTTPAEIGTGERIVKVVDGYTDYAAIPPKFEEKTETIVVERERIEIITTPATYRTVTKKVLVKPATQRWNPRCKPTVFSPSIPPPNHCLVTVAAEYRSVQQQLVAIPAKTIKHVIPAKTKTITRKVLVEPARIITKPVAAIYQNVKLSYISKPATTETQPRATTYIPIESQQEVRPARLTPMLAWCENSIEPEAVRRLQQRLQQLNYYTGAIHGQLDIATHTAVLNFQMHNGLATGAVTVETLSRLGLSQAESMPKRYP